MILHGDTRIDNYYWLRDEMMRATRRAGVSARGERLRQASDGFAARKPAGASAEGDIDRIPQREVSAPTVKNGFRYRQASRAANTPSTSGSRCRKKSIMRSCSMPTSVRRRASSTPGGLGIAPNNQLMAVAEDYLSRRQ